MKKHMHELFAGGRFFVGCNWWASHAGTNTWRDWNSDVVRSDFERLAEAGINVVRIFPLWNDFQPLRMHFKGGNVPKEIRMGEDPLPETEAGKAGIDIVMADRFEELCNIAKECGISLIVGLITGWMSGRMHAPEAFTGMNLLNEPIVLTWQTKFVKYMVKRFKDHPAIVAWDLGNECNNMGTNITRDEAYVWASLITNTIRSEDRSRPVISGMHGTLPSGRYPWYASDLGEILDVVCTHPYPLFTPLCDTEPINEMKTILHATAESVMYRGTSGLPCFVEEAGTLGPMIASEQVAADYVRVSAFSAFVHDLHGYLWWCANEQSHLTHTPYDWDSVERELGLFRLDGTKKPVLEALSELSSFTAGLKEPLPKRIVDAVCVLTHGQDEWANAYGSFILAKEAGLDIEFAWCDDEIPVADTYILPGLSGLAAISLHKYKEILKRVEEGATLYMTINDALLSPFTDISGLKVVKRYVSPKERKVKIYTGEELTFPAGPRLTVEPVDAKVFLYDTDGEVFLSEHKYGKGRVLVVTSPLEEHVATAPGVSANPKMRYHTLYTVALKRNPQKIATSSSPYVAVTEHPIDDERRVLSLINYTPVSKKVRIKLNGYTLSEVAELHEKAQISPRPDGFEVTVAGNDGMLIYVNKN